MKPLGYLSKSAGLVFFLSVVFGLGIFEDARNESGYFDSLFGHDSARSKNVQALLDQHMLMNQNLRMNFHINIWTPDHPTNHAIDSIDFAKKPNGDVYINFTNSSGEREEIQVNSNNDVIELSRILHDRRIGIVNSLSPNFYVSIFDNNNSQRVIEIGDTTYDYSTGFFLTFDASKVIKLTYVQNYRNSETNAHIKIEYLPDGTTKITSTNDGLIENERIALNCRNDLEYIKSAVEAANALINFMYGRSMEAEHTNYVSELCDELQKFDS